MDDIDKWFAEQCGVAVIESDGALLIVIDELFDVYEEWTITDPLCREIVRERFKMDTFRLTSSRGWQCLSWDDKYRVDARGKTIAEAEIACITAIYEARE